MPPMTAVQLGRLSHALRRRPHFGYDEATVFTYTFNDRSFSSAKFSHFGCPTSRAIRELATVARLDLDARVDDIEVKSACANCCVFFRDLDALCEIAGMANGTRFFVQMGDAKLASWWPQALPVVTKVRRVGGPGVLLPLQYQRHWQGEQPNAVDEQVPWASRRAEIVWRGSANGFFSSQQRVRFVRALRTRGHNIGYDSYEIDSIPLDGTMTQKQRRELRTRLRAVQLDLDRAAPRGGGAAADHVVVMRNHSSRFRTNMSVPVLARDDVLGRLHRHELSRHKYLLALEGNDVATGLKWMLRSGSVVVMPTPQTESWLLEATSLQPYVHYVPLQRPEEIDETLAWLRAHDDEARRIAGRAAEWMRTVGGRADAQAPECADDRAASTKRGADALQPRAAQSAPGPYAQLRCVIAPQVARDILLTAASAWAEFSDASKASTKADGDEHGANDPRWEHIGE